MAVVAPTPACLDPKKTELHDDQTTPIAANGLFTTESMRSIISSLQVTFFLLSTYAWILSHQSLVS